jgi:hypothetical protein
MAVAEEIELLRGEHSAQSLALVIDGGVSAESIGRWVADDTLLGEVFASDVAILARVQEAVAQVRSE